MSVEEFPVAYSFRNVADSFEWAFAGVYGPNDDIVKRVLWDELAGLLSGWDLLWCIGGDFNITCFPSERSSDTHSSPILLEFSKFIFVWGHMNIPLFGGNLTCSNNREPVVVQD